MAEERARELSPEEVAACDSIIASGMSTLDVVKGKRVKTSASSDFQHMKMASGLIMEMVFKWFPKLKPDVATDENWDARKKDRNG